MSKVNAGITSKQHRRIMRSFKINEISAVDVPAQEGATALIMKRRDSNPQTADIEKRALLTTSTKGHAHLIDDEETGRLRDGGETSYSMTVGAEFSHSHPWVRNADGSVIIGDAEGHGHKAIETTIKAVSDKAISKEETDMTKDLNKKVEELTVKLERAEVVASLSDTEKAYFSDLDENAQTAFLAKSGDERSAAVIKSIAVASDEDPVVYTTSEGIELRKSAGAAFISIAKSNDTLRKDNDELREGREQDALEKRAETELAHLPGDLKTRAAMLKALDGIEDDGQRETAMSALKAQNEALGNAFNTVGHGNGSVAGSADSELDALAKKYRDDNPDVTIEQAMVKVCETPEGEQLYAKTLN